MFSKSISDRRALPAQIPSKGSMYATVQQQQQHHQLPGTLPANGSSAEQPNQFKSVGETRNFQPVRQYIPPVLANPATPNSDDFSDPDGSVASVGASVCTIVLKTWFKIICNLNLCLMIRKILVLDKLSFLSIEFFLFACV